jgi:hypothetical protein
VKKVNRREFVTAAAMAGAGAVLPTPPVTSSKKHSVWASSSSAPALMRREVVALQARPFPMQKVTLQQGPRNRGPFRLAHVPAYVRDVPQGERRGCEGCAKANAARKHPGHSERLEGCYERKQRVPDWFCAGSP